MTRSQHARTISCLGLVATFLIGSSGLLAAAETAKPDTDPGKAASSAKSKASEPTAKKWKNESGSESKNYATPHRPLPNLDWKNSAAVAAEVDKRILQNLTESGVAPAPKTSDEDFLRRVHFDLAGTVPMPREVTMFGLDPDPDKRFKLIDKLLSSEDYAHNWVGILAGRDLPACDRYAGPRDAGDIREMDGRSDRPEPGLGQDRHVAAHGDRRSRMSTAKRP